MGDNAREIERHIDERRSRLNQDLSELEQKAQDILDWRTQVERHPGTMLGLAFGAGLLLSAALPGASSRPSRRSRYISGAEDDEPPGPWVSGGEDEERGRPWSASSGTPSTGPSSASRAEPRTSALDAAAQGAWDKIKEALLAAALVKFEGVVREVLPEFNLGESKRESRRANGESGYPGQSVH